MKVEKRSVKGSSTIKIKDDGSYVEIDDVRCVEDWHVFCVVAKTLLEVHMH